MKKILVAYDGSEPADRALTTAIDLAKAFDAAVGVVSVVPVHPGTLTDRPLGRSGGSCRAAQAGRRRSCEQPGWRQSSTGPEATPRR